MAFPAQYAMNNTVADYSKYICFEFELVPILPVTLFLVRPATFEGRIVHIKSPGRFPVTATFWFSWGFKHLNQKCYLLIR